MPGVITGLTTALIAIGVAEATAAVLAVSIVVSAALAIVQTAVSFLLQPDAPDFNAGSRAKDRLRNIKQPLSAHRVVYGETRIGGSITYLHTTDDDEELHEIITIASHPIEEIIEVYGNKFLLEIGAEPFDHVSDDDRDFIVVNDSDDDDDKANDWAGNMYVYEGLGTTASDADMLGKLVDNTDGNWTTEHKQEGMSKVYMRFKYDRESFGSGTPNITFLVKGKPLYDPRSSSTAYSNNAALCVLDYIRDAGYGLGEPDDNIDMASFITAANTSDEFVQLKGYVELNAVVITDGNKYIITTVGTTDFTAIGASSNTVDTIFTASIDVGENVSGTGVVVLYKFLERRYVCNGTFETSEKPSRIIKDLLSSCSGMLTYQGGKWALRVGSYVVPAVEFNEDDIEGSIDVTTQIGRRNLFNQVQSVYTEPDELYHPTDAPLVKNALYLSEDQGEIITQDLEFSFTTAVSTSQRLAKIALEKVRQQISVVMTVSLRKGFQVQAGDTIGLTNSRFGWSNKAFVIEQWGMQLSDDVENPRLVVGMSLRETASNVFDWNTGNETTVDAAPNTNLPNPFNVRPPTGLAVSEELYYSAGGLSGSGAKVRAIVSWTSAGKFVHQYEVQYTNVASPTETDYIFATLAQSSPAPVSDLNADNYTFRVRGLNSIGTRSSWSYVTKVLSGLTAVPNDMTGFSVRALDGSAYLSWTPIDDLDVIHGGYVRVRHTPVTVNATWNDGSDIGKQLAGNATDVVLPLKAGTYLAKAVDSSGKFSDNAVSSITTVKNVNVFNLVESLDDEALEFPGTKTNMVVVGSNLTLVDTSLQMGSYYFSDNIDLGQVYTSRVFADFETSAIRVDDLIDSRTAVIDGWANFDDEDGLSSNNTSSLLEMRYTSDNPDVTPSWSPWQKLIVGDFSARAYEFRVMTQTDDAEYNIEITKLKAIVDMPDRVERGTDSGSSTYTVTYVQEYYATPTVGITANAMGSNNHFVISASTRTGFTINFYQGNGTGSPITTSFNYQAIGY